MVMVEIGLIKVVRNWAVAGLRRKLTGENGRDLSTELSLLVCAGSRVLDGGEANRVGGSVGGIGLEVVVGEMRW